MNNLYYILDSNNEPVPVSSVAEWALWEASNPARRIVKQTNLPDGARVSTVFLGLNHAFAQDRPVLFETMIFGGDNDQFQERYYTWKEAEEGHDKSNSTVF